MSALRWIVLSVSLVLIGLGLSRLEGARGGLTIIHATVGTTPVSVYRLPGAETAPAVVIAHGFAGSRQLMEGYALSLAHSGYIAVSFDFLGHGRNPDPMRGDVEQIEGTTQLLVDQTKSVVDYALGLPWVDGNVALLGHSMATDIIVRNAAQDERIGPVVAISMFSGAATQTQPDMLLMITGAWESTLRREAQRVLRLVSPTAVEGQTVFGEGVVRRAVVAPNVEHVGVLYSTLGMREARDWLNLAYGRTASGPIAETGLGIVLLLAGIVMLAWPISTLFPAGSPPEALTRSEFWMAASVPAVFTPIVLAPFDTRFLPVLVADYLTLHLLIYGALTILILRGFGHRIGPAAGGPAIGLALFGILVFGGALDHYVAAFMPAGIRPFLIAAIALGAVPYMLGEAKLLEAGHAGFGYSIAARLLFLASLALAVTLDFERLMFLVMILPVIALFFIVFGSIGGWVGRRTGSVSTVGWGLGLILAWALGVTFPMFVS